MENLELYSVSDQYISYLRKTVPNVYSNKEGQRSHTRKYLGIVFKIENYKYYIPLSSPKDSDYILQNGKNVIRKSTLTILRIISEGISGEDELKGTVRISNMIPVPDSELELYDVEQETDTTYKDLIQKELIFIRKSKKTIIKNAGLIYKQKKMGQCEAGYMNSILDFSVLEHLHDDWEQS
ncbi:MAG: type III toxin-antitoxin system ToxN/AbiQ family toxin [Lachnospiraceae bacterium]|nr:type III toxin-antitoxin system ToxN/AbiQ family toxin [Lachnospiraceae bacterium]